MSVIWITHDLGVVAGLCDRVNIFYGGRIAESAGVDALYQQPHHPYTKALFQSIPRMDAPFDVKLETIPGTPPKLDRPLSGCPFAPRCEKAMPQCLENIPQLELAGDHQVACFAAKG